VAAIAYRLHDRPRSRQTWTSPIIHWPRRLRSPARGPDGNLYISSDIASMNEQILKVVPS
jgi:hypothetical protein